MWIICIRLLECVSGCRRRRLWWPKRCAGRNFCCLGSLLRFGRAKDSKKKPSGLTESELEMQSFCGSASIQVEPLFMRTQMLIIGKWKQRLFIFVTSYVHMHFRFSYTPTDPCKCCTPGLLSDSAYLLRVDCFVSLLPSDKKGRFKPISTNNVKLWA